MAPCTFSLVVLALAPLNAPLAAAWGTLGHDTVAFIAQNFISKKTAHFAQQLLNDSSSAYLANVATWADSYRYTAEGSFSAPLHYIDAFDKPPQQCNVDYKRDCPEEGCIVSAIANYTSRITDTKLPAIERQKALKWIVHFLGDIHQPLHVENLEIGGNTINVTFDGVATNLHHIWDSNMMEKLIGGYNLTDAQKWATSLTKSIKKGKYESQSKKWTKGMSLKDKVGSALIWARDANSYMCTTVLPKKGGVESIRGKELDNKYYDTSIPVITLQIAKAGYRLAAWLDLIVEGSNSHHWKRDVETAEELMEREADVVEAAEMNEEWMVEARLARRAFGGCQHEH
ncbi:hypothetical protein P154DRAFT_41875 [Amniculicola lignicola CBS 123094]|uniref:Nuclease PA3 n=1 Tax=Amniculicola lignicola CBS 123094 TaxID=1392246 RepID=A0A6A5WS24_9PLEO|nr:hypothetical protein P154DRAFT_41875 [Amniculicola lignicola CBS 123094]